MDERDTDRDLIGRFLLGTASEDERQQAEQRLFAEDDFLAELQDREDALIDDYAHGRLADQARGAFERRFLASPQGRARVAFARAAARLQPREALSGRSWTPRWLPAAAAAVFAIATVALGVRTIQVEEERRDQRARSSSRELALARQLEDALHPTLQPPREPALVLRAQGTRDSGVTPSLRLAAGIDTVVIAVPLPAGPASASYQAVLRTAEGAFAWEDAGLHPDGGLIRLTIPARALPPGDYIVTLAGRRRTGPAAELADHYFRVVG